MRFFNNLIFKILLGFMLLDCSTLSALTTKQKDDINSAIGVWSEYSTYTTALNNIITSMIETSKDADIKYAIAMETLIKNKKFQNSPYNYDAVKEAIDFVGVDKMNLAEEALEKIQLKSIDKYQKVSALEKEFSNLGVFADTLGFAMDLYSLTNNVSDFVNEKEWGLQKASLGANTVLDLYNVYSGSLSIMQALSTKVPTGTLTKVWLNNPVAKGVSSVNSSTMMGGLGAITIGATIEAKIYELLRDKKIETVTSRIFSIHQTTLEKRLGIFNSLLVLWKDKEVSSKKITSGELLDIINGYLNVRPVYSEMYKGKIYSLSDMFRDKLSKEYLSSHYSSDSFENLRNDEKIDLMLDALVEISIIEDSDLLAYLDKTVTNGQTVADMIFGAFDSDIYKIYDTDDLKNKMFPYFNQSYSAFEYYNTIYKSLFHGKMAQFNLEAIKRLGKDVTKFYNSSEYTKEVIPKIFLILEPGSTIDSSGAIKTEVGNKVELIFSTSGEGITEFVKEAVNQKETVTLWYDDFLTEERKAITLKIDDFGYTDGFYPLYFEAPSKEFRPLYVSYYDSNLGGNTTYSLMPGYNMEYEVSYEADNENSDIESSDPEATEIAKQVGNHLISSTDIDFSSQENFLKDDILYVAQNNGVSIYDVSDKAHPTQLSFWEKGYRSSPYSATMNYPYIFYKNRDTTYIIDISDSLHPVEVNSTNIFETPIKAFYQGYAYTEDLKIYSVSNPDDIRQINTMDINLTTLSRFEIREKIGYASGSLGRWNPIHLFQTVDFSTPTMPKVIGSLQIDNYSLSGNLILYGDYALIPALDSEAYETKGIRQYGLLIIDISNTAKPRIKYFYKINCKPSTSPIGGGLRLEGDRLYVKNFDGSYVYNIKDIRNIQLESKIVYSNNNLDFGSWSVVNSNLYSIGHKLKIFDVSNPKVSNDQYYHNYYDDYLSANGICIGNSSFLKFNNSLVTSAYKTEKVDGEYVTKYGFVSIDISDLSSFSYKFIESSYIVDIKKYENYIYGYNQSTQTVDVFNVSDLRNKIASLDGRYIKFISDKYIVINNFLYEQNSFQKIAELPINTSAKVFIKDDILYSNNIYNISDVNHIEKISTLIDSYEQIEDITLSKDNRLFISYSFHNKIFDVTDIYKPVYLLSLYSYSSSADFKIVDNLLFMSAHDFNGEGGGLFIYDISNPKKPDMLYKREMTIKLIDVDEKYIFSKAAQGIYVVNWQKLLNNELIRQNYYYPESKLYLTKEFPEDYTVKKEPFTKQWKFDKSINSYNIEVLSNSYQNKDLNFVKSTNYLSVDLTPNKTSTKNELKIKLTDGYGNKVTIGESDILWSITKTNHAPRLADGQVTQLVSASDEPAVLDIETYDGDGDTVTLSIVDRAGGSVTINGNRITASFTDGEIEHTIKVALNDGKERVVKEFYVLQFDNSSIEDFYSDVSANATYPFDGIAFGTLKGVIWGQSDPDDPAKRIFRPTDDASMAEALAMIINAEKKAGLITLDSANYYMDVYPNWAMPYYTFAKDSEAIDEMKNLANYYPTREEVAKIVVKTLHLDDKVSSMDFNGTFSDESDFSSTQMLRYAEVANFFGLFMTDSKAKPKEHINRAELATVIEKIFMIPSADISFTPDPVEYGDSVDASVANISAEVIDSSYNLIDNSENIGIRYIYENHLLVTPIDTTSLLSSTKILKALITNRGVRNIVDVPIQVVFTDSDNDGVQDQFDVWKDDPRYCSDNNNNKIPDILDTMYELSSYNADGYILVKGHKILISDIIKDGGYTMPAYSEINLSAMSVSFDDQQYQTTSEPKTIVITNTGNMDLLNNIDITGTNAKSFYIDGNCSIVQPLQECLLSITFNAQDIGVNQAVLNITSNDLVTPKISITLSGKTILEKPIITKIPNVIIDEDIPYSFIPSVENSEVSDIVWSFASVVPQGMSIDTKTGTVTWSKPTADNSPYNITIKAQNSAGYDTVSWTISVAPKNPSDTIDTDGDGMGDKYEREHGLNPLVNDADKDDDKDGISNIDEFRNGTDPQDSSSCVVNVDLQQGWNMISLPLKTEIAITSLQNPDILTIYSFENDKWIVWSKDNNSTNSLSKLSFGYGYWIKVSQDTSIVVAGYKTQNTNELKIDGRWHLVGSMQIDDTQAFLQQHPDIITLWKFTDGSWKALSSREDIQEKMDEAQIEYLYNIKVEDGFMYK